MQRSLEMFQALAAEDVNLKMITTGDIKISVLVEEDGATSDSGVIEVPTSEPIKKSHLESKKAVRGRRAGACAGACAAVQRMPPSSFPFGLPRPVQASHPTVAS